MFNFSLQLTKLLNIYLILFNYITLHAKDGNIISAFFKKIVITFAVMTLPIILS